MKKNGIIVIVLLLWVFKSNAQDAYFSQFYAAPLFMSPSLAGSSGGTRFIANYRNQWPGIEQGFQTYAASADFYIDQYRSGIGAIIVNDRQGALNLSNTFAGLQYSYRVKLAKKWQMVPGLQASYGQRSFDQSKLLFIDQIENGTPGTQSHISNTSVSFIDAAASLFFYSPKWWTGFSVDHLLRPNYSFDGNTNRQTLKFVNFGGMNVWGNKAYSDIDTKTAALCYRYEYQSGFSQLDLGLYWYHHYIDLGLWYRGVPVFKNKNTENHYYDNEALIFLVGISTGSFRFGYSYDLQLFTLSGVGNGAHELSVMFELGELFGYGERYFECFTNKTGMNYNGLRFNKKRPRKMEIY